MTSTRRRLAATATLALATLAFVPVLAGAPQDAAPYRNASLPVEQRVNDLLGRMTLDEKVGQMIQPTPTR